MFPLNKPFVAVLTAISPFYLYADHSDHQHHQDIEIISVMGTKQPVATNSSAMKMDMSQLDTPGSISVYGSELIEAQRATTLGQVLKNDASVSVGNVRRNRERFYMRGFVLEPDQSYLRDGQFHLSRYAQPIELYDRVEVLKGPSALLYGKSTPGGMINLVTKRAVDELQFNFQQEFGSFGFNQSVLDVGGGLNGSGSIRSRAILSKSSQDGWRKYKDGSHASQDRFVGALMLEADLSDDTSVSVNYDRTEDEGGIEMGPQHLKNKQTGKYELAGKRDYIWDMPWSNRESTVENIGFTLNSDLDDSWSINMGYNQQQHERKTLESLYGKVQDVDLAKGTYALRGRNTYEKFDVSTAFFDLKGEFYTGEVHHRVLMGTSLVDYERSGREKKMKIAARVDMSDKQVIDRPDELDYRYGDPLTRVQRQTYGVYVQDMIEFNDHWHLLAGVRFDREQTKEATHNNILPKLGLLYHPTESTTLYTTYSESFEPKDPVSNTDDKHYGKSLDAERGQSIEFGAKGEFLDGGLFISTALFSIEKSNKVVTDKRGKQPVTTQSGKVRHQGIELSLEGRLTDSLSILTSMMYLDARITQDPLYAGKRSKDTPKFSTSTWFNYDVTDNSQLSLGAVYVGERFGDTPNEFSKEAYVKVDMGYSHKVNFANDHQAIFRVNIDNLLNADYLRGGCSNSAMFGDGRSIKASVQYKF
ncbi:TonB-dependent siderophore receptor [Shewanella eurypsychrophilus]|uniref:TonB-dependent siderophore receptor n=1 Tax=Shewanella eurypsychrophilus TaxID=2593656 RepID=A0ABX8S694_9GAMM|nr:MULTISPECIES: TonB-dependent siderophore receptor [Shewanella]QFU23217.1 TonB-dependent siderophore receptor [Shewanella sp. YLB-09]QXP44809.1 TonB-dependent siderophore receptor [Shewanella eurypsychrophilus]